MYAIILAAGMGKRLKSLTKDKTKCMVEVNGITLIERTLAQLDNLNLDKIILVVGYQSEKLKEFINNLDVKTPIEYVYNNIYDKTNNIYSLFLAKHYLETSDCLILESDLIFENGILEDLINDERPNLALVDKFKSWMDGTVVTVDGDNITNFYSKDQFSFEEIQNYYKTVNIYKFSQNFSENLYIPFLEAYIKSLGFNEYYEQVLKVISNLKDANIQVKKLDNARWYEIDDIQDLNIAESIFAPYDNKLDKFASRYGGYWRYPYLTDYSYFVHPYYPPQTLISELKSNFEELLFNYPSSVEVNNLLVSKYFNIDRKNLTVGNGTSDVLKSLIDYYATNQNYNIGLIMPTLDEYSDFLKFENITIYDSLCNDFRYNSQDIIHFFKDKNLDMLIVANPDITGNYVLKNDLLKLIDWTIDEDIALLIDESFIDFIDAEPNPTFLNNDLLDKYPNLIVLKSISKSFGVPGLRLCILASGDKDLVNYINNSSIWNINSFAEFYLQIFEKYVFNYDMALNKFKQARKKCIEDLNSLEKLNVIPSQSCYVICEIDGNINSHQLANILLNDYDILVKDLSNEHACNGRSFIKVAIRDEKYNELLFNCLKEILS